MDPTPTAHLDPDTLAAYVDGRLAIAELGRADRHIDACRSCRLELSTLAAIHTQPVTPQGEIREGTLGRYHVLRELGRGSMGIVLRAWDPELARPVAIKLVHDVDASTRDLLRREARALAKLRHANVVTVYDVIVETDALYVAMELVEGDTLRGYCAGRASREILEACVRAGKGLAAAHDAGVIHRDFKPENVLCGERGEVKVSDFGLARATDEKPDRALAGTPAYMAPEVLRREPATTASDQFSFCVSVWELLTGDRPTGGAPGGAPKASVAFAPIPAWVIRVLRRGLERDPAARYPSMHALVAALEDDPNVRRRRHVALGAGALVALAAGAMIVQLAPGDDAARCSIDERALGDAWTAGRKASVAASITSGSDGDTARRAVAALDDHALRWIAGRRDACVAARESQGEQAAALQGRRVACLDRNRRELAALTALLASADRKLAGNAQEAISRLGVPEACATGSDVLPDDAAGRVIAEHGRTVLARANALQYAGKSAEADQIAGQLLEQLSTTIPPRLAAEALLVRARAEVDRGKADHAEELLFEALHAAERGHDDVMIATLWVEIVGTTGAQKHRFDLALSNARAADAALARIEPGAALQMRYAYTLGTLLLAHGRFDDARARLQSGLALGASDARQSAQVALTEVALCDVERQRGKLDAAKDLCSTGIPRLETALGPNHIRVAVSLSVVGALAYMQHDLAAAESTYKRMLGIFELRSATEHSTYALALSNLGAIASARDDVESADSYYTRSLAIFDAHHPTHPQRLMAVQGLAGIALRDGKAAAAIPLYQQILDVRAATYAVEHPMRLMAEYNLALAYRDNKQPAEATKVLAAMAEHAQTPGKEQWSLAGRALSLDAILAEDRGDLVAALALHQRAVTALEHDAENMDRVVVLRHVGETQLKLKRPALAIAPLERALAFLTTHEGEAFELGSTRFLLGRALYEARRDVARALPLFRQASDDLARAKSGTGLAIYRRNVARFLHVLDKKR